MDQNLEQFWPGYECNFRRNAMELNCAVEALPYLAGFVRVKNGWCGKYHSRGWSALKQVDSSTSAM